MTIQQNIDYRVSVLDKVGVKITDTDGTQRPIISRDLKINPKNVLVTTANSEPGNALQVIRRFL